MDKDIKKDIRIMPYLPLFVLAGIYGLGVFVFSLLAFFPLNGWLERIVFIIFGFTKEIMPLHKAFNLFDNYLFMGQWPTALGLLLDVSAIFLIVFVLNFSFLHFLRLIKRTSR